MAAGSNRRMCVVEIATGLLTGCAAPAGPSWVNFKSDAAIETAAADDSFPSAAEAGLASLDKRPGKDR